MKRTLGLDLGPNSIGWAIVEEDSESKGGRLIDMGVRVFTEGLDSFDTSKESSRNEQRRVARGMRRQTARRRKRRAAMAQALQQVGLWPSSADEQARMMEQNPYELRAKAVSGESLTKHELGRVFLHLAKRRGFLSNRKTDASADESKGLLAEIVENEAKRVESGKPTLGSWLFGKLSDQDHRNRKDDDHVRRRHLSRKQYQHEFDEIWKSQSGFHPELLTDKLRWGRLGPQTYPMKPIPKTDGENRLVDLFGIEGILFFQRKMYWPTEVIGRCELEPKKRRCPLADRRYQRFRIWQELNNLRYVDPDTHQDCQLSIEQRQLLFEKLWACEKMSFTQIRKALGFLESVKFNFERGERSVLKGNLTDHHAKKAFGKEWLSLSEDLRDRIIEGLTNPNLDDRELVNLATQEWKMSSDEVSRLMRIDLGSGYGSVSLKAINRLLPHLERGLTYSLQDEANSALHAAGYVRRDQLKRRIFDFLPSPQVERKTPIGDIPNPVVKRTLTEVRKLVNAIIREYGKPDGIHIEMARSLKMGQEKRKQLTSEISKKTKEREAIAEIIQEQGQRVTRENILRYQLWKQQNHECIYSGKPISLAQLLGEGSGVEVDHILPRSRTLDDSQSNKVLCFRTANQAKGNRTPFEWLGASSPEKYEEILQRANLLMRSDLLPYSKYKKLLQKEVKTDEFVSRQLVDTAYITKVTGEYLKCLFDADHHVLGLKGALTAELRWQWGLETVLESLPDSPAWQTKSDLRPGEKNRADHRHHAIDALVIALTNRSRLQALAKSMSDVNNNREGELLEEPWPKFRETVVERVSRVWVSHRVERKIRGPLHDETQYGKTDQKHYWVYREKIDALSSNDVANIRDPFIRNMIIERLKEAGIDVGRKTKADPNKIKEALVGLKMPSGVPIRKVRILKKEQTVVAIRKTKSETFVKTGSNHHLAIFEWTVKGKKKRDAYYLPMIDAIKKVKNGREIIDRSPPAEHSTIPSDAKFLMTLSTREAILTEDSSGQRLLIFRSGKSTTKQMIFVAHSDARKSKYVEEVSFSPSTIQGRKVTVDYLGRIRNAND